MINHRSALKSLVLVLLNFQDFPEKLAKKVNGPFNNKKIKSAAGNHEGKKKMFE